MNFIKLFESLIRLLSVKNVKADFNNRQTSYVHHCLGYPMYKKYCVNVYGICVYTYVEITKIIRYIGYRSTAEILL